MSNPDAFAELAPYYDNIMEHVNYDRWFTVATSLTVLLPGPFRHVDLACGTGVLLKRLRRAGWNSVGLDLSFAMVKAGRKDTPSLPVGMADLRALPLNGCVDYATCLFDSVNFLTSFDDVVRAFREVHRALTPHGLFYFDIVTERMVTEHFEGQEWTEDNGRFSTTWRSSYSRKTSIADTHVRVNTGDAVGTVSERIYTQDEIKGALAAAGFGVLGLFDAHSWKAPTRRTVRIDVIAAKDVSRDLQRRFDRMRSDVRVRIT